MSKADYGKGHPLDHASPGGQIRRVVAEGEAAIRRNPWIPPLPLLKTRIGMVFDAVERALGGQPK